MCVCLDDNELLDKLDKVMHVFVRARQSMLACFVLVGKLEKFKCLCSLSAISALVRFCDKVRQHALVISSVHFFVCCVSCVSAPHLQTPKHGFDKTG